MGSGRCLERSTRIALSVRLEKVQEVAIRWCTSALRTNDETDDEGGGLWSQIIRVRG